jgi:hypothetical protein
LLRAGAIGVGAWGFYPESLHVEKFRGAEPVWVLCGVLLCGVLPDDAVDRGVEEAL